MQEVSVVRGDVKAHLKLVYDAVAAYHHALRKGKAAEEAKKALLAQEDKTRDAEQAAKTAKKAQVVIQDAAQLVDKHNGWSVIAPRAFVILMYALPCMPMPMPCRRMPRRRWPR